jgi:hypothetical protein
LLFNPLLFESFLQLYLGPPPLFLASAPLLLSLPLLLDDPQSLFFFNPDLLLLDEASLFLDFSNLPLDAPPFLLLASLGHF